MNLVKVNSTSLDKLKRRIVKFLRYGKSDVQTSVEAMPYGIDSNPVKDMIAVYGQTEQSGDTVIIGYLNKNLKAGVGELRTFATDSNGTEKFYTWMKSNGTMEIGGNVDNMVRYSKLQQAFDQLKNEFTAHVHQTAAPGSNTSPPTVPSTADITPAKINEIKTL